MSSRVVVVKESTFWVEFCATLWWTTYEKKNKTTNSLPSSTAHIYYFCLNVPAKAHALHRFYAGTMEMCLGITSCKLLMIRQEFASLRKSYCISSLFQTFNLNPLAAQVLPLSQGQRSLSPCLAICRGQKQHSRGQSLGHRGQALSHSLPTQAAAGRAACGWLMFSRRI